MSQTLTAAAFSCCFFVGLPALYSLTEKPPALGRGQVTDLLVCFGSLPLPREVLSNQICGIWVNLGKECKSVHFRIHPNNFVHAITLPPPYLTDDVVDSDQN